MKGIFVVVDGLDGVGKGVFINSFVKQAKEDGKRVFDADEFATENDFHPSPNDLIGNYDVVLTSEPTFCGIGRVIRNELTEKNGRHYSSKIVADAFALDRRILYEKLVLPLLDAGIDIYQSRSFSTSLVYQRQTSIDEGVPFSVSDILEIPGNAFCHTHPMNYLVIPTIDNVEELMRRLAGRDKDDNCDFENPEFQIKLKPHYESIELRETFESIGTKVTYLDASITVEHSEMLAREFYNNHLKK